MRIGSRQDLGYIATALEELNNINLPNDDGAAVRLENALALFREGAVEDMNRLPDTGNTNWDAVFAVDALRNVWWRNTGHDAPAKALNPASEFASFLRDGFGYLNVEAAPSLPSDAGLLGAMPQIANQNFENCVTTIRIHSNRYTSGSINRRFKCYVEFCNSRRWSRPPAKPDPPSTKEYRKDSSQGR